MRTIIILIIVSSVLPTGCGGASEEDTAAAVEAAKAAYAEARERGVAMEVGPCLGIVMPNWVADVAHDPRQPVDDDPANQCEEYRSGEANHFVELDPAGNLIRAR